MDHWFYKLTFRIESPGEPWNLPVLRPYPAKIPVHLASGRTSTLRVFKNFQGNSNVHPRLENQCYGRLQWNKTVLWEIIRNWINSTRGIHRNSQHIGTRNLFRWIYSEWFQNEYNKPVSAGSSHMAPPCG